MRRLFALSLLVGGVALGAAAIQPAHAAAPLKAVVVSQTLDDNDTASGYNILPIAQERAVVLNLQDAFATLVKQTPGWECVQVEDSPKGHLGIDIETERVVTQGVKVRLELKVGGPSADDNVYRLRMGLTVVKQGAREVGPEIAVNWDDPTFNNAYQDPIKALISLGTTELGADLMPKFSPCTVRARVKLTSSWTSSVNNTSFAYNGDDTLKLGANGTVAGTIPLQAQIVDAVQGCSLTVNAVNPRIKVSGSYDDGSDNLNLRMQLVEDGVSGGGSCGDCAIDFAQAVNLCHGVPVPSPTAISWDISGGSDLPVALADGAQATLPRPTELQTSPFSWDGSLGLSYGNGSATAAS